MKKEKKYMKIITPSGEIEFIKSALFILVAFHIGWNASLLYLNGDLLLTIIFTMVFGLSTILAVFLISCVIIFIVRLYKKLTLLTERKST